MNTNTITNTLASQDINWALTWTGGYATYINTYRTTSDLWVEIRTRKDAKGIHISMRISNNAAFFDVFSLSFYGINRETVATDFIDDYLESEALKEVCMHFDEVCTPYGRCED